MTTLKISATEPQAEFHRLQHLFKLFLGGYGVGKSNCLVDGLIIDALRVGDGRKRLVSAYEPTYDLVKLILVERIMERLETDLKLPYTYNASEYRFYIEGAADIVLRSLTNPERIIGYEAATAHIDELDTLPRDKAAEVFRKIVARTRFPWEGPNTRAVYTTPEGYRFAYETWIKGQSFNTDFEDYVVIEKDENFACVMAATKSNPFLPEGYIEQIEATYPTHLLDAYLRGIPCNLTSGTVYRAYNRGAHNSSEKIRPKETLFIGCDFNVQHQAATVWVKREGGEQWHAVAELCDMYDTPEMVRIIQEKWQSKGHKIVVYPDASGKSRKTVDASISDIALLQQAGFEVRVKKVNPLIKDRVLSTNTSFEKGRLYVNAIACPTVAACLEQQAYDKNGQPDKTSGMDHQNDATTYPIAFEMPIRKPVMNIPFSFAV